MLSAISKTPELELTEDESKKMAKAAADVANLYEFTGLSEKQMAWYNLTLCAGSIYGTKYFAYSARTKEERKKKRAAAAPPVAEANAGTPPVNNMPDLSHFIQ